jgi:hypothetical protein
MGDQDVDQFGVPLTHRPGELRHPRVGLACEVRANGLVPAPPAGRERPQVAGQGVVELRPHQRRQGVEPLEEVIVGHPSLRG